MVGVLVLGWSEGAMVIAPPSWDDDSICRKGDGAEDEHDDEGDMVGPPVEIGGGP